MNRNFTDFGLEPLPNGRVTQQDILPTAVKNRQFGSVILETATATGTAILSNGESQLFTLTTITSSGARILNVPDMSLYVGSIDSAHQLPGGSSVTPSEWQVIFMGNDWGKTDGNDTVTQVYVRNISAGSNQTVYLLAQGRGLANVPIS